MRKWGEIPRCTAAVSVETGTAAKAGHWETEKVGIRTQEHCSLNASQKTDYGSIDTDARVRQMWNFYAQKFGCGEESPQPFFIMKRRDHP